MISAHVSDTIRVAYVLCLLLLVCMHAQQYTPGVPDALFPQDGVIYALRYLLGHTSVTLLGLVSGYLLAQVLQRRPYETETELGHKVTTLVIPLVLWNLVYLVTVYLESRSTAALFVATWPNSLLALTDHPAMMPLYFLRDAFVCFLFSPEVISLARRAPWLASSALHTNAVLALDGYLFINSAIPFFYFLGCYLQVRSTPIPSQSRPTSVVSASRLVMLVFSALPILSPLHWGLAALVMVKSAFAVWMRVQLAPRLMALMRTPSLDDINATAPPAAPRLRADKRKRLLLRPK